jgi:hypothetical protein
MRRPRLVVKISYEPGHVGAKGLIDAYSRLVSTYKRCARGEVAVDEPKCVIWSYRRTKR